MYCRIVFMPCFMNNNQKTNVCCRIMFHTPCVMKNNLTSNEANRLKLFYFGGSNTDGTNDRVVEKYSFDVGEIVGWQSVNEAPEAIVIASGVSDGHFLYLYGVWTGAGTGSETKLLSMDIRTEQWTYHDTAVNGMHTNF